MTIFKISFCIPLLMACWWLDETSAFNLQQPQPQPQPNNTPSRRHFLEQATIIAAFGGGVVLLPSLPAYAAEEVALPTREIVTQTFEPIKFELRDPQGGVATMQGRIDAKDFTGLMEFTRTYDLEMRKLRMGRAKKLMSSKEMKEIATSYANAVTFDLIGMNRNSRIGQENQEAANKYLQELRDDVTMFLELEGSIEVKN
jgi:hypothetical protein